jgi:serine/threonine protein phosphatase 1
MEKIIAIGDIHGCLDKLEALMDRMAPSKEDLVVFLGDYIDRGSYSCQVVDYVLRLKEGGFKIITLLGNHELMLLDALRGESPLPFLYNGGWTTLKSYGIRKSWPWDNALPEDHLKFYQGLVPYFETPEYLFIHAGFHLGRPLAEQSIQDLVWIREEFYGASEEPEKLVIFGHTPFKQPFQTKKRVGIDTGAVYGGNLTALELPAFRFYQA